MATLLYRFSRFHLLFFPSRFHTEDIPFIDPLSGCKYLAPLILDLQLVPPLSKISPHVTSFLLSCCLVVAPTPETLLPTTSAYFIYNPILIHLGKQPLALPDHSLAAT